MGVLNIGRVSGHFPGVENSHKTDSPNSIGQATRCVLCRTWLVSEGGSRSKGIDEIVQVGGEGILGELIADSRLN